MAYQITINHIIECVTSINRLCLRRITINTLTVHRITVNNPIDWRTTINRLGLHRITINSLIHPQTTIKQLILGGIPISGRVLRRSLYLPEISYVFCFRQGNPSNIFYQLIHHQCNTVLSVELLVPLGNNPQVVTILPDVEYERNRALEGTLQITSSLQSCDGSVFILKVNNPCRDVVTYRMPVKVCLVKVQRAQNLPGMADSSLVWNCCYHVVLRALHEVLDRLVGAKSGT